MHVVLVGPGALGCLLSSRLTRGNRGREHRFTLLDHNATRAAVLAAQGIRYHYKDEVEETAIPVSSSPSEIGMADVVILCVKSYDLKACISFCAPMLGPDTLLLFLQNGVAHLDMQVPAHHGTPAYGTTTEGANLLGSGQVRHAGKGLTQFGFLEEAERAPMDKLQRLTELFNQSGLKTRVTDDILSRLWTKLMVNTGINGLTAILGCTNGELLTLPGAAERMKLLVEEALSIAIASNIYVPPDSLAITNDVCAKTATNISSMLQDVRAKRRTEIDAINGAVVTAAGKLGMVAPENLKLVAEVKELERGYLKA